MNLEEIEDILRRKSRLDSYIRRYERFIDAVSNCKNLRTEPASNYSGDPFYFENPKIIGMVLNECAESLIEFKNEFAELEARIASWQ